MKRKPFSEYNEQELKVCLKSRNTYLIIFLCFIAILVGIIIGNLINKKMTDFKMTNFIFIVLPLLLLIPIVLKNWSDCKKVKEEITKRKHLNN